MYVLERIRAHAVRRIQTKTLRPQLTQSIASITFDDFPKSSWQVGGPILERYQASATYYVAGSLCGKSVDDIEYYNQADLAEVYKAGHEIGSHSFAHRNVRQVPSQTLLSDFEENEAFVQRNLGDIALETFAYPFGQVSLRTKNLIGRHFASSRGTEYGINDRVFDLAQLKIVSIESHVWSEQAINRWLAKASSHPSWIIFLTHDISDNPTRYGSTPAMLEKTIEKTLAAGIKIDTVTNALELACPGHHNGHRDDGVKR